MFQQIVCEKKSIEKNERVFSFISSSQFLFLSTFFFQNQLYFLFAKNVHEMEEEMEKCNSAFQSPLFQMVIQQRREKDCFSPQQQINLNVYLKLCLLMQFHWKIALSCCFFNYWKKKNEIILKANFVWILLNQFAWHSSNIVSIKNSMWLIGLVWFPSEFHC